MIWNHQPANKIWRSDCHQGGRSSLKPEWLFIPDMVISSLSRRQSFHWSFYLQELRWWSGKKWNGELPLTGFYSRYEYFFSMNTFWILWGFNALMALIPIYFFFVGLADGSISSSNMIYWVLILLVVAVVVGGTLWLKSMNMLPLAKGVLWVAAVPGVFAIIFFAVILIGKPRWNWY